MMNKLLLIAAAALILGGCESTSQYTSGADYLKKYDQAAYQKTYQTGGTVNTGIDSDVRRIAAIEPNISFPSRIGIARIEHGHLTSVPMDEAHVWKNLTTELGAAYGAFIPVSPLITEMVRAPSDKNGRRPGSVVDDIRRGSARQHLDHVLIYEVNAQSDYQSNSLRLADLTILGLYVLPSRDVKVEAFASAMLIDVRNGYPYGTASAFAEKDKAVTSAGSRKARAKLTEAARLKAVGNLSGDVEAFMQELWAKAAEKKTVMNKAGVPETDHNWHN